MTRRPIRTALASLSILALTLAGLSVAAPGASAAPKPRVALVKGHSVSWSTYKTVVSEHCGKPDGRRLWEKLAAPRHNYRRPQILKWNSNGCTTRKHVEWKDHFGGIKIPRTDLGAPGTEVTLSTVTKGRFLVGVYVDLFRFAGRYPICNWRVDLEYSSSTGTYLIDRGPVAKSGHNCLSAANYRERRTQQRRVLPRFVPRYCNVCAQLRTRGEEGGGWRKRQEKVCLPLLAD